MKRIMILLCFISCSTYLFSQVQGNILRVQGESVIYGIPEEISIKIPINVRDSSYVVCSNLLIEYYNNLVSELVKNGIDSQLVKSDIVKIQEDHKWDGRNSYLAGFIGEISVGIDLKYEPMVLNKILDVMKNNSSNLSYTITFHLSKEQKEKLLEKAIEIAIEDAKFKAKKITEELGLNLIKIKDINYGYTLINPDQLAAEAYYNSNLQYCVDVKRQINLNPEKIEIRRAIGIIWEINK